MASGINLTLIVLIPLLLSLITHASDSNIPQFGTLHPPEVDALRTIGKELNKDDWDFVSQDPCGENSTSWRTPYVPEYPIYINQVICGSCSAAGVCHVLNIYLVGQNLTGVLPPSLAKLPYLKRIALGWNYLKGSIPRQWASMKLDFLYVETNQLSGEIPKQLGDMSTLIYLNLENNQFSGKVPTELGKLVNLLNLTKFQYIVYLLLNDLCREIMGSGFMGPLPSSISNLTNLRELRISDLHGQGFEFPPFQNMVNLRYLVLRNCNISGFIPDDIAVNMPILKTLDLSFNNLKGNLPIGLKNLRTLENMFLTSNFLNGTISNWIQTTSAIVMDLSYNNFDESSVPSCYRDNLNLFRSSSRQISTPLTVYSRSFPCSKARYSLHINC